MDELLKVQTSKSEQAQNSECGSVSVQQIAWQQDMRTDKTAGRKQRELQREMPEDRIAISRTLSRASSSKR